MANIFQGIGSDILAPVIAGTLEAPGTQAAVDSIVARSLQSPEVRAAMRPIFIEAAAWVAAAFAVGALLFRVGR